MECSICLYELLEDQPYAIIDIEKNYRYHPECLDGWLRKKKMGLITYEPVDYYSIYHQNELIEKVDLKTPIRTTNYTPQVPSEIIIQRDGRRVIYECSWVIIMLILLTIISIGIYFMLRAYIFG